MAKKAKKATAKTVRTDAHRAAEAAHEERVKKAGHYAQINVKIKTAERMDVLKSLRKRFPKLTDAAIAWKAIEYFASRGGN